MGFFFFWGGGVEVGRKDGNSVAGFVRSEVGGTRRCPTKRRFTFGKGFVSLFAHFLFVVSSHNKHPKKKQQLHWKKNNKHQQNKKHTKTSNNTKQFFCLLTWKTAWVRVGFYFFRKDHEKKRTFTHSPFSFSFAHTPILTPICTHGHKLTHFDTQFHTP